MSVPNLVLHELIFPQSRWEQISERWIFITPLCDFSNTNSEESLKIRKEIRSLSGLYRTFVKLRKGLRKQKFSIRHTAVRPAGLASLVQWVALGK